MNAKHFVATLALTLAAGAAFAALKQGPVAAPATSATTAECTDTAAAAIPRVVVTAKRDLADAPEAPVARIVVTAKRLPSNNTVAVAR